jgi:hypothetical protein
VAAIILHVVYDMSICMSGIQNSKYLPYFIIIIIIIIVTVTKSYSVYIKYYSKQGEKIMVLVRILMSNYYNSYCYKKAIQYI